MPRKPRVEDETERLTPQPEYRHYGTFLPVSVALKIRAASIALHESQAKVLERGAELVEAQVLGEATPEQKDIYRAILKRAAGGSP